MHFYILAHLHNHYLDQDTEYLHHHRKPSCAFLSQYLSCTTILTYITMD